MIVRSLAALIGATVLLGSTMLPAEPEPWRVPDYPAPVATRQPITSTGINALPPSPTPSPVVSRASRSRSAGRQVTLDITAYCWTGNRTASGAWPELGHAAVLDRSIPFGTRMEVPGIGVVTVTDRIGHSSGLDIYMGREGCQARAEQFGRQRLTVTLITPGARA